MYYLSRIELDCTKRETLISLIELSHLHGAVENAFPGERKRRLWRIDGLNGKKYLLILSDGKPDLKNIQQQFGYADRPGESLNYDNLLNRITNDSLWRFRLTANPTFSRKQESGVRGKICSEVTPEFMLKWIQKKAQKNGFELIEDQTVIRDIKWHEFSKRDRSVRFKSATFEGFLKIQCSDLAKTALLNGIGREKAYGMGMLTLIRAD